MWKNYRKCTYMNKAVYFSTLYLWNFSRGKECMVCLWGTASLEIWFSTKYYENTEHWQAILFLFAKALSQWHISSGWCECGGFDQKANWLQFSVSPRKKQNFNFTWQIAKLSFIPSVYFKPIIHLSLTCTTATQCNNDLFRNDRFFQVLRLKKHYKSWLS